eukprot:2788009-Amphidinium_carterae.1
MALACTALLQELRSGRSTHGCTHATHGLMNHIVSAGLLAPRHEQQHAACDSAQYVSKVLEVVSIDTTFGAQNPERLAKAQAFQPTVTSEFGGMGRRGVPDASRHHLQKDCKRGVLWSRAL